MGLLAAVVFLLWAGIQCSFRATAMRDKAIKAHYAKTGLDHPTGWQKVMFTRTYIWSFRIGGIVCIAASVFLVWIYFYHPHAS